MLRVTDDGEGDVETYLCRRADVDKYFGWRIACMRSVEPKLSADPVTGGGVLVITHNRSL